MTPRIKAIKFGLGRQHLPLLSAIAVFALVTIAAGQAPARAQIIVTGQPAWGVNLLSTSDPAAAAVFGARYATLLQDQRLVPPTADVVLLLNASSRIVVGYQIRWDYQDTVGAVTATHHGFMEYSEPGLLLGKTVVGEFHLQPGAFHLVSPRFNAAPDKVEDKLDHLPPHPNRMSVPSGTTSRVVKISLDGLLFADGSFVGPDTGHFIDSLQMGRAAEHDAGVFILRADAAGMSDAELAQNLKDQIASNRAGGKPTREQEADLPVQAGSSGTIPTRAPDFFRPKRRR